MARFYSCEQCGSCCLPEDQKLCDVCKPRQLHLFLDGVDLDVTLEEFIKALEESFDEPHTN